jgi:lysozyme family protein
VIAAACWTAPCGAGNGANTAALQVALRLRGVYPGPVDGILGSQTVRAVRRFQHSKRLVVDGVVGPRTRKALGAFARHRLGSRAVRPGMTGWDAAALQYLLVRCDLALGAIDGISGPRTRSAVVRFQRRAGLAVDGVVGAATLSALRRQAGCRRITGRVPSGVTIGGLRLAGLTAHWAKTALRSAFAKPVALSARGQTWLLDPDAFAAPHVYAAVSKALHARAGRAVPLRVKVDAAGLRRYARVVAVRPCSHPRNARLVGLRHLRPRIARAHPGCRVAQAHLMRILRRRFGGFDRTAVRVPLVRERASVTRSTFGSVVVIRRRSHRLFLYSGTKFIRRLPVGTGRRSHPTPLGRFTIRTKIRNPWRYPPPANWADGLHPIPPGPGNPLGTRWMGLGARGIGIHGTPDASSIGYSRSHGCVRLLPREAEWLFRRVRVGTPS